VKSNDGFIGYGLYFSGVGDDEYCVFCFGMEDDFDD